MHACLPESLDRYYQEVGRSGRDGHASVSILIPAFEDWSTARNLAQDAIITVEKAQERWKAMRTTSEQVEGGGRRVRLGQVPAYLFRESDTNAAWNLRTLLLLQQAGVLRIRLEEPPRRFAEETDEAWDARMAVEWDRQRTSRIIDLLVGDFENEDLWRVVEKTRGSAASRGIAGFDAMARVLSITTTLRGHSRESTPCFRGNWPYCLASRCTWREHAVVVLRVDALGVASRGATSRVRLPRLSADPMSREVMDYFAQETSWC